MLKIMQEEKRFKDPRKSITEKKQKTTRIKQNALLEGRKKRRLMNENQ